MNKNELADKIYQLNPKLSKKEAQDVVKCIFDTLTDTLVNGDTIHIEHFGDFSVTARAEREGVNPQTRQKITIPSSFAVKFKSSKYLKKCVNDK